MSPGDVVPTLALMSRHIHPEDRGRVLDVLGQCGVDGEPFGCQYPAARPGGCREIRDPDRRRRERRRRAAHGDGFLVDITAAQRDAVAHRVNEELTQALRSHAVIDQAKGAFMLGYGIDGEAAFELLRWGRSSATSGS